MVRGQSQGAGAAGGMEGKQEQRPIFKKMQERVESIGVVGEALNQYGEPGCGSGWKLVLNSDSCLLCDTRNTRQKKGMKYQLSNTQALVV